jgi:hypothetical protein
MIPTTSVRTGPGVEPRRSPRRGGHTACVATVMVGMGGYGTRPNRASVSSRLAKLPKSQTLMTLWRLYSYDTLLEGLAPDLQDVAAELRQLI